MTNTDRLPAQAVARMLRRALLWPIDRTFNMLRRRVAMFERPSAHLRTPRPGDGQPGAGALQGLAQLLWRSPNDGRTAAERLGLAQGEVRIDHVVGHDVREAVERL